MMNEMTHREKKRKHEGSVNNLPSPKEYELHEHRVYESLRQKIQPPSPHYLQATRASLFCDAESGLPEHCHEDSHASCWITEQSASNTFEHKKKKV